jgi:hypothetical protein
VRFSWAYATGCIIGSQHPFCYNIIFENYTLYREVRCLRVTFDMNNIDVYNLLRQTSFLLVASGIHILGRLKRLETPP